MSKIQKMNEMNLMTEENVMNENLLSVKNLSAGYSKKIVVSDLNFDLREGEIVTLIGPNGSGKSTVLKTITKQLATVFGSVAVCSKNLEAIRGSELSKAISVVSTEKPRTNFMTCREVIESGRYPHTNVFGTLTKEDREICDEAIKFTHLEKIADTDFLKISDGQKQRVLLARAICQDTKIIVLDEPTSYLDMFYKLDILKTIHFLARKKKKSIIMSLHELELVKMISDTIICVGDGCVKRLGKPGEIFTGNFIQNLYGINDDEFDPITCTVKLHL